METRQPQTFNFADPRMLRGEDARIDRASERMGISGAASPLPARSRASGGQAPAPARAKSGMIESKGYDKIATTQEKEQAGPGSGGKKDKCNKGKSCGAACIFLEKDCILELPETVNVAINQVRDMLQQRVSSGAITEEEARGHMQRLMTGGAKDADPDKITLNKQRAQEIIDSLDKMKEKHTKDGVLDEKAYNKEWGRAVDIISPGVAIARDKNTPLTIEDFEGLKANEKTWKAFSDLQKEVIRRKEEGNAMSPEELQTKLRPIVETHREKITDEQVQLAKALMPETERNYFRTAGALDTKETGGRFPSNPRGDALPVASGPLKAQTADDANNRLDLITRTYLEHGGKSPFTGTFVPITRSDLEHGIAENHAGRAAEQGLNYSPLKTSLNVGRGNKDHAEYFGGLLKKLDFDDQGRLTPASRAKVEAALAKAAEKSGIKSEIVSASKSAKTASDLREILGKIEGVPDPKMQSKLYNKLVSNFLSAYGNVKVAETARAGIQSHGRGEQAWYWYGDTVAGGGAAARRIADKMTQLLESGQTDKAMQLTNIMAGASAFIKKYVNSNVATNTEISGKPAIIMGGTKTPEVTKAVIDAREQILNQIEAL
jgi:hypothetical protein